MSMKTFFNIPAVLLLGLGIGMASQSPACAAPLVPIAASQAILPGLPLVSTHAELIEARYYWHHHYWHHHYWHHHYWHPHYYHRWHYYHRRHYYRPYWHRRHYWHPHYYHRHYYSY
jgi:hypothetical protein